MTKLKELYACFHYGIDDNGVINLKPEKIDVIYNPKITRNKMNQ